MSIIKLPYRILKDPKSVKKHLNRFEYENGLLRKSTITFTPPIFVSIISENCNLRCPTCYFLLQDGDKFSAKFIDPAKFENTLKKYNGQKKAEVIFLAGGEPLLHPELDKLIAASGKYDFKIKMSTNGILVKEKISSLAKLDYVNVSLDSYDYNTFRKNRGGSPGQFDSIMEGLAALKEHGILFSVSFLLSDENLHETDMMLSLAETIRPGMVHFHNINPHDAARYNPLKLTDEKTRSFLKKITGRNDYHFDIYLPVIFDPYSAGFRSAKCIQPWYYFFFNTAGDIAYCCQMASDPAIGNAFAGYDFNSPSIVQFRESIMKSIVPQKCLYCQRRFMGKEYGRFNSKKKRWIIS